MSNFHNSCTDNNNVINSNNNRCTDNNNVINSNNNNRCTDNNNVINSNNNRCTVHNNAINSNSNCCTVHNNAINSNSNCCTVHNNAINSNSNCCTNVFNVLFVCSTVTANSSNSNWYETPLVPSTVILATAPTETVLNLQFTMNITFDPAFTNENSQMFKDIDQTIRDVYQKKIPGFISSTLNHLIQGSVIAQYSIKTRGYQNVDIASAKDAVVQQLGEKYNIKFICMNVPTFGNGQVGDIVTVNCNPDEVGEKQAKCQANGTFSVLVDTCVILKIQTLLTESQTLVVMDLPSFLEKLNNSTRNLTDRIVGSPGTISTIVDILVNVANVSRTTTINKSLMTNFLETADVLTSNGAPPGKHYIRDGGPCWLNWYESKALLAFVIPALSIVAINFVILLVVLYKMLSRGVGDTVQRDERNALYVVARCLAILTPIFGLTWALGVGTMVKPGDLGLNIVFSIFNSLQGFFILVFGTLLDKKVWEVLAGKLSLLNLSSNRTRSTADGVSSSTGFLGRRPVYNVSGPSDSRVTGLQQSSQVSDTSINN
ncbi:hypothetical protein DPEC_G00357830 [Dallia pectoralis]|uniref:Uncharacterized protein n=1 Tax=Dallia pectoralis TaxID=75939 RepID=A0ACC2F027_DALPE|nr:hypothetical protein DPEC_G00357830 [Dallia pectoralis]